MARIAHARHAYLQQLRIVGPVRLVAICAVFHNRRMLPKEWAAALSMTAIAVLVGGGLQELVWVGRAVRIMAACAGYFPFPIWHV